MGNPRTRRAAVALSMLALLSACTSGSSTTAPSTTEGQAPSTTTLPAASTSTTTTLAPIDDLEVDVPSGAGLLITYDDSLSIRLPGGDSASLIGDYEVPLAEAFDDMNGGIVFQYALSSTRLDDSILHLRRDAGEPIPLVTADDGHQLRLLDVDTYRQRLGAMYLDRAPDGSQTVSIVGLDGGAPTLLAEGRAILSGSLGGDRFSYTQQGEGCRIGYVVNTEGQQTATWPCPDGGVGLTLSAESAAWLGPEGVEVGTADAEPAASPWAVADRQATELFDFDGSVAVTRSSGTAFRFLAADGTSTLFETSRRVRSVTLLRALGGLRSPDGQCSGSGAPSQPTAVDGLTLAALETRSAIVTAAHACDFVALGQLADVSMTVPADGDLARYWIGREQQRFDDLSVMIRILDLGYAQITDTSGNRLFVWPAAAASDSPSEAEWQELGAVYNEEDVETMRQAGRYGGVVMTISAEGAWLSAGIPGE